MLKNLFTGVFALALATASVPVTSNQAVNANGTAPLVIDNFLSLCQAVIANGDWLDDSGTCDAYTSTQTAATLIRYIYVTGDWILKDLDLTFIRTGTPFIIRSGSLTIDGGHYTSPNCVVWIQYRDGEYIPDTKVTINSGTFEATVTTTYSDESPSPVCLATPYSVTAAEAQRIIDGYLPAGKKFVNLTTQLRTVSTTPATNSIENGTGYVRIDKNPENRNEVKYLKTTRVAVIGEEPESTPEEPTTTEEPTTPTEPETTPEIPSIIIPKAPATGRQ